MKLHHIALAAAALVAGSANAAMTAAQQAAVTDALNNGRIVSISGASAVQKGFVSLIGKLFTAGTPVYFTDAGKAVGSASFIGVVGTMTGAPATGTWAGQNVIVLYRVKGGSVYGVDPVARNTAIDALNVSTTCGTLATATGSDATPYDCTTSLRAPDAGVSDVAPALFKSPINTEGETPAPALTATELATLTASPIYGLAFGIPVTKTVPATTRFSRATVAAIMSGNVFNWNQVDSTTSGDIVICRRTPGSGTQAVMNLWAGNYPCSTTASNIPLDRDASAAWDPIARKFTAANGAGGPIVIENATSTDVRTCLDKAVTGGTYTTADRSGAPVTVDFGTGNYKAIGVLSMDSLAQSTSTGNWQFRAQHGTGNLTWDNTAAAPVVSAGATGMLPTLDAYRNGDWDMQGWESFNVPARTTGAKLDAVNKIKVLAQDPNDLANISSLKYVSAAIPVAGTVYPAGSQILNGSYLNNDQCAPYNRNFNY